MKTNKQILSRLLMAIGAFVLINQNTTAEPYNPSCSAAYRIDETLENGARWDMCWEHRNREGIVFKEIHYTPKGGDPVTDRRLILNHAAVAQIHVPYDDNGARYHDISDYGIGSRNMLDLNTDDCPNGSLLKFGSKDVLCKQIETRKIAYKSGNNTSKGTSLSLFSISPVGAYYYIPTWRFMDDGSIEPWMGATGALQRFGSNESRGWKMGDNRVGIAHLHNFFWKLDFDLNGTANNDVVEEINFPLQGGKRQRQITSFTSEASRKVNPDTMRRWRIRDKNLKNGNNHSVSYDIVLGDTGHQDIGPASEPFTHNDFYVTKQKTNEVFASHNPSGKRNLAQFVDGESINNNDLVIWTGVTFYHMPRSEDAPHMDAHWSHMQIIPRDWHASNPLTDAPINTPPSLTTPANQTALLNTPASLTVTASDADGDALNYSATGLPTGLLINTTTGVISGTPSVAGSFNVNITVSDGTDNSSALFNWVINVPNTAPVIITPANQTGIAGSTANLAIQASDVNNDPLTYTATGLPIGLTINSSTGVISGTASTAGSYTVKVSVNDGTDTSSVEFNWVVTAIVVNTPPQVTTPANQTNLAGSIANLVIRATDVDGDTLSYAATGLPTGLTINASNGRITGRPITAGTYTVKVNVNDGTATSTIQFSWLVNPVIVNVPPSVTTPANQTGLVGSTANLTIVASDANGDTLTYAATGLPTGLSINPTSGVITGTATTAGNYTVQLRISDGSATTSAQFSWRINAVIVNTPPSVTTPANQSGLIASTVNLRVIATDANNDPLTYSATGLPAGLQINSTTGRITGSLTTQGNYTVTITVRDATSNSTAQFNWVVTAPVVTPGAISNEVTLNALTLNGRLNEWSGLTSFATDPDDVSGANNQIDWLKATIAHDPQKVYLAYQNRNNIDPSSNTGAYIPWGWQTYLDTDNDPSTGYSMGNTMGADYLLEGNVVQRYTGTGSSWSWQVAGNAVIAYQGKNAELSFARSLIGNPQNMRVIFNGDNFAFGGTAGDSYPNTGYFDYTFSGASNPNTRPVADAQQVSVGTGASISIVLTATDVDNDPLNYSIIQNPTHGSLSGSAPNLVYTANTNYTGADSFTFKVNDGAIDSALATVSITVTPSQTTGATSNFVNSPIQIDGNENDWSASIERFADDADDVASNGVIDWKNVALAHDNQNMYLLYNNFNNIDPQRNSGTYLAWGWQVMIDSDKDSSTGLRTGAIGADFLIEGGKIHRYTGSGSNWSWQATGDLTARYSSKVAELSLPRSLIANTASMRIIFAGDNQAYQGHGTTTDNYPDGIYDSQASVRYFEYDFNGGGGSNTRPVAYAQTVAVDAGTSANITLVATDSSNGALTYAIEANPLHGTLTGSAPHLVYTPDAGFIGQDQFSFKVNNGTAESATVTVTLNITGSSNGVFSNLVSSINVNGNNEEWTTLTPFPDDNNDITGTNNVINWQRAAVAHDATTLYFMYQNFGAINPDNDTGEYINWGWQVYLDTDHDDTTGFKIGNIGADYILEGEQIQRYTGNGSTWSWARTNQARLRYSANTSELSFPRALIGNPDSLRIVFSGDNQSYGGNVTDSYPETGFFKYQMSGGLQGTSGRPEARSQTLSVTGSVQIDLSAIDPDSDALTFRFIDQPEHGTLSAIDASGKVTYTAKQGYEGTDSFRYVANDGTYDSSIMTVSLNVSTQGASSNQSGGSIPLSGLLLLVTLVLFRRTTKSFNDA